MTRPDQLTYKQQRFVEEMVADPSNATAAAKRAGYAPTYAKDIAYQNMQIPKIAEKVEEANEQAAKRLGITKELILQKLWQIASADFSHAIKEDEEGNVTVDLKSLPGKENITFSEVSVVSGRGKKETLVKITDKDRRQALIDIARMLGWDKEKVEVTGKLTLEQLIAESFKPEVAKDGE